MADKLPGARAALVDNAGVTTPPFYRYFQALERLQAGTASAADVAAINAQIAVINAEIASLPKSSYPKLQVSAPLTSDGLLQNGFARLGWKGTTSDVPEGTNLYYTDARVDARLSPGYIDGLQMQWVSGTAVTVSSGTAYIPGLGHYLQSNTAIALSGLALSASTWYHLYLYSNAGTPAVECVTTIPVLYNGTAYQKTGDNTRRYIGSIKTDANSKIFSFIASQNEILYREDVADGVFRVLSNGTATSETNVSCAAVIPSTSRVGIVNFVNATTTAGDKIRTGTSDDNFVAPGALGMAVVYPQGSALVTHPLDSSQSLTYWFESAPATAGGFFNVFGYHYAR